MKFVSCAAGLILMLAVSAGTSPAQSARFEPFFAHNGTGTLLHPLEEPETIPYPPWCHDGNFRCSKDHVYIFGVNGLNPMCLGNFNGMLDYFRKQGFTNTYFDQMYTCLGCASEIRKIRAKDPDARIVLVGFSLGANSVKIIANDLNDDGTRVDLLVYLAGDMIWDTPGSKPANVRRILNIRGQGIVLLGGGFDGANLEGARNETLKCRHILAPSRRESLTIVMEELMALACVPMEPVLTTSSPTNPMAPRGSAQPVWTPVLPTRVEAPAQPTWRSWRPAPPSDYLPPQR